MNVSDSLRKQLALIGELRAVLPSRSVLFGEEDTRPYECDGLAAYRQLPLASWPCRKTKRK